MLLNITEAEYIKDYMLWIKFNNGVFGVADFKSILGQEIFQELVDDEKFIKHAVDHGTITWDSDNEFGEIDIAPEYVLEKLMILKNTNNHEHYDFSIS
jgi:hypothetical protein|tara:strand:- start:784 stop:1077 length:294 start_codon:yes stop_codon:yes gene_type:complete